MGKNSFKCRFLFYFSFPQLIFHHLFLNHCFLRLILAICFRMEFFIREGWREVKGPNEDRQAEPTAAAPLVRHQTYLGMGLWECRSCGAYASSSPRSFSCASSSAVFCILSSSTASLSFPYSLFRLSFCLSLRYFPSFLRPPTAFLASLFWLL